MQDWDPSWTLQLHSTMGLGPLSQLHGDAGPNAWVVGSAVQWGGWKMPAGLAQIEWNLVNGVMIRCFMLRDDLRKWLYDLCLSLSLCMYVCIYIYIIYTYNHIYIYLYIYINITHSTTVYYNHTLYIISYTHICAFACVCVCVCICTLQLHIATSSDLSIMIVITHITILVTIIAHNNKQW